MPDTSPELQSLVDWLAAHAVAIAVVSILLLVAYRGARPTIHRLLVRVIRAQAATSGAGPAQELETDRRVETLEDLLNKLLRLLVLGGVIVVVFAVFDLWPLLAGLGLVLAALTFAGQSVVLDVIMGILILLEGQYFKGDTVLVGTVQGVVEEVGIRRTVVRDSSGTLHSISNGIIRQSSNLTRTYAMAVVEIDGVADRDVEAVIEALNAVGAELAESPDWAPVLLATPACTGTTRLSSSGATVRLAGRVRPEARFRVEAELRRRAAAEMAERGIELIRPGAWRPQA